MVNFDQTTVSQLHASQIQTQIAISVWTTTNGHQQVVGSDFFTFAVHGIFHRYVLIGLFRAFGFSVRYDFDAGLRHVLGNQTGHVFVEAWQYGIHTFDDRYFGAKLGEHLAKLSADITAADDDKAARNFLQFKRFCRGQDASAKRERFQLDRAGTGSQNAMLEAVTRRFVLVERTSFVFVDEHHFTAENFDLVTFKQAANALGHLLDNAVLEFLRFLEVHFHVLCRNPEGIGMLSGLVLVSGRDQRFGRDTTAVQADAAKLRFVNDDHLLPELGGTNGRHISAGTCTDN
ncbi:hypothetical protein D3C81_1385740 [compost metagenome]